MGSKSKDKGTNNEYDVRDLLTSWLGKPFQKCPNSGALRWGTGTWTYGDLVPPEEHPFAWECKHYAEIVFDDILGRRTKKSKNNPEPQPEFGGGFVSGWWYDQTVPDAYRASQDLNRPIEPALVWKQDYHRMRLCLREALYSKIDQNIRKQLVCCWTYIPGKQPFMMLDFENFLQKVSPSALQEAFYTLHASQ